VARVPATWIRRTSFVAILLALAIAPGPISAARPCTAGHCQAAVALRWTGLLPGSWTVQPGLPGVQPARGQAYAALSDQVAAVGLGMTVYGYAARTGVALWITPITGLPAASAIASVRVWPGVVAVGVDLPSGVRREVVLAAASGRLIRSVPAALFGGAVQAGAGHTVIVGATAVTSYDNRTGRAIWTRSTGPAAQDWQVDGSHLYVTVAAGGYLGTAPVTALRRINLRTGAERLVRPAGGSFAGVLSQAFDGVLVFSGAYGATAYSGTAGGLLWRRAQATAEYVDTVASRIYLAVGSALIGVDARTGRTEAHVSGVSAAGSSGLYGIRGGVFLGLDPGPPGRAWGYEVAGQRVLWTSPPLPWPHYFVDLSGIGGSADPARGGVLLAICAQLAPPAATSSVQACMRPELVVVDR
jgi:hypothetical protein